LGIVDTISVDEYVNFTDKYIVPLSEKMVSKNGAVIYLRLPESGEHWDLSAEIYPKEIYWDEFAKRCGAESIHFVDYPELSKFECPEGSHLDYEDAKEFTKNLAGIVKKLDCLPK